MKKFCSKAGKDLNNHILEMDRIFKFHLSQLAHAVNEEDIHYLRRSTKRLKALYKFFGDIDPDFISKKRFNPVGNVYEPAGKLRELQVNQKLLIRYNSSPILVNNYELFINEKKNNYEKSLAKSIKKFESGKHKKTLEKIETICRTISKEDLVKSVSVFLVKYSDKVKTFITNDDKENSIHNVRILFKTISPVLAILEIVEKSNEVNETTGRFKNAEDRMGSWHDREMLRESLKEMIKNKIDKDVKTEARSLINKINADNKLLIKEAIMLIKQSIEMADKLIVTSSDTV